MQLLINVTNNTKLSIFLFLLHSSTIAVNFAMLATFQISSNQSLPDCGNYGYYLEATIVFATTE